MKPGKYKVYCREPGIGKADEDVSQSLALAQPKRILLGIEGGTMGYLALAAVGALISWIGVARIYGALKSGSTWASGPGGFRQRTVLRTAEPNLFWLSVFAGGAVSFLGFATVVLGIAGSLGAIH